MEERSTARQAANPKHLAPAAPAHPTAPTESAPGTSGPTSPPAFISLRDAGAVIKTYLDREGRDLVRIQFGARLMVIHLCEAAGRTPDQVFQAIEEVRQMWGPSQDGFEERAKKNPREELKLQKFLVKHHTERLAEAERRIDILEGRA